jgi:predicted nucleic acid-binding protein
VPHFLDTNILLYSISSDPTETRKAERAQALLDEDDGALSVQVLQEFYTQATRPNRIARLPHPMAVALIETWTRFQVQDITLAILNAALQIHVSHRFSYWDSAIIAAARAMGCRTLYSEDMQAGRAIDGLTIVNPFQ